VVLGGQEFTEALQQTIEALQYGQIGAEEAAGNMQADAASILERPRDGAEPHPGRGGGAALGHRLRVFLMRQFIAGVPDELIDAARMDGASEPRILFSIVAPSVMPAIAALALFAFVYHWNTYLWPLTVLQGNSDGYPIVLSLGRLLSYNRGAMNTGLVLGVEAGSPAFIVRRTTSDADGPFELVLSTMRADRYEIRSKLFY
jgi:hypothetical protein